MRRCVILNQLTALQVKGNIMKNSFKKTAEKLQSAFETRHRPAGLGNGDGPAFYCLADDAPQWMKDAVFTAHDSGDRMPCDYIYDIAHDAVLFIAENCDGENDDDRAHEFADGAVSVYNHDRAEWLSDHAGNAGYVDDAVEEGLADITGGIFALIGAGMYRQIEEIYSAIYSAIEDESDESDETNETNETNDEE